MTSPKKSLDLEKETTFFGELEKVEVMLCLRLGPNQEAKQPAGAGIGDSQEFDN
jgi:hypothetical protein